MGVCHYPTRSRTGITRLRTGIARMHTMAVRRRARSLRVKIFFRLSVCQAAGYRLQIQATDGCPEEYSQPE